MSGPSMLTLEEYEILLNPLAKELSQMARWVSETGQRLVIVFEGRDTAGKGDGRTTESNTQDVANHGKILLGFCDFRKLPVIGGAFN